MKLSVQKISEEKKFKFMSKKTIKNKMIKMIKKIKYVLLLRKI